jgi:hypothetical protein
MNMTGWDRLYIHTSVSHPDERQSFAAGYLEGFYLFQIHLKMKMRT